MVALAILLHAIVYIFFKFLVYTSFSSNNFLNFNIEIEISALVLCIWIFIFFVYMNDSKIFEIVSALQYWNTIN